MTDTRDMPSDPQFAELDRYLRGGDDEPGFARVPSLPSDVAGGEVWKAARAEFTSHSAGPDVNLAWQRMAERVNGRSTLAPAVLARQDAGRVGRRATARWIAAVGAAVVVAIGLVTWRTDHKTTAAESHVYQTAVGQTATISLAGGSVATLGPATTMRVASTGVTVSGEAYFAVVPNPGHPFVVHTVNATAQVLGTRFAVRQYANDASSRIVVEDGKVAVRRTVRANLDGKRDLNSTTNVLTAGMLAQVGDSSTEIVSGVAIDDYTGWTHGRLRFTSVPLHEVLAELSRAYGVDVRVTDSVLAKQRVTLAASTSRDPLPAVLDFLARSLDARSTRVGETFVIVPGRVSQATPRSHPFLVSEKQHGR